MRENVSRKYENIEVEVENERVEESV